MLDPPLEVSKSSAMSGWPRQRGGAALAVVRATARRSVAPSSRAAFWGLGGVERGRSAYAR